MNFIELISVLCVCFCMFFGSMGLAWMFIPAEEERVILPAGIDVTRVGVTRGGNWGCPLYFSRDLRIVFLRSNRISNRIGRIYHASRNTV